MNTPDARGRRDRRASRTPASGRSSRWASPTRRSRCWWFGLDWGGSVETIDGDLARRIRKDVPERRPGPRHHGPRHPRHQLLQARRRPVRVGAGQGARYQHHGPRRDGPVRLHEDAAPGPQGHGPPLPQHDVHPLVAPARRRMEDGPRLRRQRLAGAADRAPDGPRLGARTDGRAPRHPGRAELGRGHHGVVRPVHPDARDLRVRAGSTALGVVGRGPRRQRSDSRPDHGPPGAPLGDARRRQGRRASPIGQARSRRARRPTW